MSQYAQYEVDSPNYDTTRVPIGLEIILGCLTRIGIPLGEQAVLEAGCGTGNYLQALLPVLGSLVGVDCSEQMLDQARATVNGDVELMQGDVLNLPMGDESFDAVLSNQVIHHLGEGPGVNDDPSDWSPSEHAGIAQFLGEAHRVLRPGGSAGAEFFSAPSRPGRVLVRRLDSSSHGAAQLSLADVRPTAADVTSRSDSMSYLRSPTCTACCKAHPISTHAAR